MWHTYTINTALYSVKYDEFPAISWHTNIFFTETSVKKYYIFQYIPKTLIVSGQDGQH